MKQQTSKPGISQNTNREKTLAILIILTIISHKLYTFKKQQQCTRVLVLLVFIGSLLLGMVSAPFWKKTPPWLGLNQSQVSIKPREIIVRPDKNGHIIKINGLTISLPEKNIWDWLELYAVIALPVLLLVVGHNLKTQQKELEEKRAKDQKELEEKRAKDQKELEDDKLRNQRETEIYVDYLKRLGTFYREVKTVRRLLISARLTTKFRNDFNPNFKLSQEQIRIYNQQMQQLNQSQLGLEALKIEATFIKEFRQDQSPKKEIEEMEKYINSILHEYQEFYYLLNTDRTIDFCKLTCLNEFTGETDQGKDKEYKGGYKGYIDKYKLEEKYYNDKYSYRFKKTFSQNYADIIKSITEKMKR